MRITNIRQSLVSLDRSKHPPDSLVPTHKHTHTHKGPMQKRRQSIDVSCTQTKQLQRSDTESVNSEPLNSTVGHRRTKSLDTENHLQKVCVNLVRTKIVRPKRTTRDTTPPLVEETIVSNNSNACSKYILVFCLTVFLSFGVTMGLVLK
eukprot:GDKI01015176.1.p1 GENE.GDKI01015176.1~~GDKI01015176.1.p1  ORF type:complete len:164 (+),score=18.71 GDKI01015176.1:46-492(+)